MSDNERYEVRAKNHTFVFDCNRPLVAKKNLDHYPWQWRMVAGRCPMLFQKEMQDAMERHIRTV